MNKKQKWILITAGIIVLLSIIVWLLYGGEIFTKTQVLVEKKDELFGFSEKQWVNKFVWGVDLTLAISCVTIFISGLLIYLFRDKKKAAGVS
jgi:uncharacterized integral membrane protein